jgi:hypothetical protein
MCTAGAQCDPVMTACGSLDIKKQYTCIWVSAGHTTAQSLNLENKTRQNTRG